MVEAEVSLGRQTSFHQEKNNIIERKMEKLVRVCGRTLSLRPFSKARRLI